MGGGSTPQTLATAKDSGAQNLQVSEQAKSDPRLADLMSKVSSGQLDFKDALSQAQGMSGSDPNAALRQDLQNKITWGEQYGEKNDKNSAIIQGYKNQLNALPDAASMAGYGQAMGNQLFTD